MKIRMYDSITRFFVQSEKNPEIENLVDLTALDLNGECSCEDFRMVKLPNLRNKTGSTQCKHLMAAREFFAYSALAMIKKGEDDAKAKAWMDSIPD